MITKKLNIRPQIKNTISYFQIFRYAKWYERLSTILGVIFGILSGGGFACILAIYGELTTSFFHRTSHSELAIGPVPLLEAFGGGRRLINATHQEKMEALMEDGFALGTCLVVCITICLMFCVLSVKLINWSALRQIKRIRLMFLQSVLHQDMAWFDTDNSVNLTVTISEDMMKLKDGMGDKLTVVTNLVGSAMMLFCQCFPIGWELALCCMAVVPFSIVSAVALSRYQTSSSTREMQSFSKAGKEAEETLKSIRTVVAFEGEQKAVESYNKLLLQSEKFSIERGIYNGIGMGFSWFITYMVNAIGFACGARFFLWDRHKHNEDRNYEAGDMFSIIMSVYIGTQMITFCIPHVETFAVAKAAAAGIFKILDQKPAVNGLITTDCSSRKLRGEIALKNVEFSYPSRPDIKVLKGLSLHISPGETVALVGTSGCGKSTILQLIQRLYDPNSGVVMLDGKCAKTFNVGWLRSSLGVVGQEPVLFHGTIFENITIGIPTATREEVKKVAEIAYAHEFISKLPDGYDTMIGERGASLSGGQKQRIAIARSLLREPAVLLLDEATSALDPHSERQVQAALDRASQGRTTLVVSHRLSTIVNANRIICIDKGEIVEMGNYEALMEKKGVYYKLMMTEQKKIAPDILGEVTKEIDEESRKTEELLLNQKTFLEEPIRSLMEKDCISSGNQTSINHGKSFVDEDEYEKIKPASAIELLKHNSPEWKLLVVGSIAAFVKGACFPSLAIAFGKVLETFVIPDDDEVLAKINLYTYLFIIVAIVAATAMFLQSYTLTKAGLKMTTRLRLKYFKSLLSQEIGYHDRESNTVGALCSRLNNDVGQISAATGIRIGLILQGFSSVFFGLVIGSVYNWKMMIMGAALLPLMQCSFILESIMSKQSAANERKAMELATSIATEALISIRTVQSLGVEHVFLNKLEIVLDSAIAAVLNQARWRGLVLGASIYLPLFCYVGVMVYGVYIVVHDGVRYENVFIVSQSMMSGGYMLGQSLLRAPNYNSAKACGARILATINRLPKVRTDEGIEDCKDWVSSGQFNIKNVGFSYPSRPYHRVLRNLDLKVEAGKMVALVGASGSGKSTVLQLLQRFYDPDTGIIELDNVNTRTELTLPRLRRQLGVVQQEPVLFDRTLAENIAYGDNSRRVSMHEIVAAAKAANIHNFIVSLPKGYDTNLGSSGAQLSGGQKQRICIARALIRSPRLLLLDEATSALDANSQKAVSEALEAAAKDRTCISIAHRLSTIKNADVICVVDKGAIVEQGTHEELMNLGGHYWIMSQGQHLE